MFRVLNNSGIASFVEPGPAHSKTPASQSEMREHQVIENDIVIEDVWKIAETVGFFDIKLWLYTRQPLSRSLAEFATLNENRNKQAFLEENWSRSIYPDWLNLRTFTLYKSSSSDGRTSQFKEGLNSKIKVLKMVEADDQWTFTLEVKNSGSAVWLPSGSHTGCVNFGPYIMFPDGRRKEYLPRVPLSKEAISPGAISIISLSVPTSALSGGGALVGSLVAERIAWFDQLSSSNTCTLREVSLK